MAKDKGFVYDGPADWLVFEGKAYQPGDEIPIELADAQTMAGHRFKGVNGWGEEVNGEPAPLHSGPISLRGTPLDVQNNTFKQTETEQLGNDTGKPTSTGPVRVSEAPRPAANA